MGPVIDDVMITRPWPLAASADEHGSLEVHRKHLLDVVGREFFEPARWEDARIGADDVQAPVSLDGGFDSAATILRIRHIGRQAAHLPGLAGEVGDRGVEVGLVARGNQYVHAGGGEGFGDTAADALATPGDDGGTALK
jgi:hypothetical protein